MQKRERGGRTRAQNVLSAYLISQFFNFFSSKKDFPLDDLFTLVKKFLLEEKF